MRRSIWILGALGLVATGGCQLVAGVRTDAELADGGKGSTSSSDASSSSSDTGSSSSSGAGPCTSNTECTGAGQVCIDGACETPTCDAGAVIDIFSTLDLGSDQIQESELAIASDGGDHVYVGIVDNTQKKVLVRALQDNGQTGPIGSFAFSGGAKFKQARFRPPDVLALEGTVDGVLGELQWTVVQNQLSPTFVPYAHACTAPDFPADAIFAPDGASNAFIAVCGDNTHETLIAGADDDANPVVLGMGPKGMDGFHVDGFARSSQGFLASNKTANGYAWRGGATKADLVTQHAFALGPEPDVMSQIFGITPLTTGDGYLVIAAHYRLTAPTIIELWSGIVTDVSTLSAVPPTSLTKQVDNPPSPFEKFGETSEIVSSPSGYFFSTRAQSLKHATISWFSPKGQLLVFSQPAFTATDMDTTITGTGLGVAKVSPVVVWTEKKNGAYRVRGTFTPCLY